ncbi:hypothetical protein GCM10009525_85220 [Streptosporangium amethystogenes subsp. fukuiense]
MRVQNPGRHVLSGVQTQADPQGVEQLAAGLGVVIDRRPRELPRGVQPIPGVSRRGTP